jgi:hypothetical protein
MATAQIAGTTDVAAPVTIARGNTAVQRCWVAHARRARDKIHTNGEATIRAKLFSGEAGYQALRNE